MNKERAKQTGGKFAKLPEITQFKHEHPFLDEIDSLALANAKQQFSQALKNWWKSMQDKRKGRKVKERTLEAVRQGMGLLILRMPH